MKGLFRYAIISDCGLYRYRLARTWDDQRRPACFIMLNPSTADASEDDPTIRRCVGFARGWQCGGIEVVNLFALRATNPNALHVADDPIGPTNDRHIRACAEQCCPIVCAWGVGGIYRDREKIVMGILRDVGIDVKCLGITKHGRPKHPLYLPGDAELVPFVEAVK